MPGFVEQFRTYFDGLEVGQRRILFAAVALSMLILVGVATDTTRKVRSELVMQAYDTSLDDFYGNDKKKK